MQVYEIKGTFGSPVVCPTDDFPDPSQYCVLGAAIMFKHHSVPEKTVPNIKFPCVATASAELGISYSAATAIADANDDGNFATAWRILDAALRGQDYLGCDQDPGDNDE